MIEEKPSYEQSAGGDNSGPWGAAFTESVPAFGETHPSSSERPPKPDPELPNDKSEDSGPYPDSDPDPEDPEEPEEPEESEDPEPESESYIKTFPETPPLPPDAILFSEVPQTEEWQEKESSMSEYERDAVLDIRDRYIKWILDNQEDGKDKIPRNASPEYVRMCLDEILWYRLMGQDGWKAENPFTGHDGSTHAIPTQEQFAKLKELTGLVIADVNSQLSPDMESHDY